VAWLGLAEPRNVALSTAHARFASLTGVAAVVVIAAGFATAGNTPAPDAPTGRLVLFYAAHDTGQLASGALLSLGALLFLVFAAFVCSMLRRAGGAPSAMAVLCLAGGVIVVVGLTILAGFALALGDVAQHLGASALQAVHVLSEELVFTLTVGTSGFLLGAGLATLQTAALPRWTGWLALVFGVVAAVPSHILGGLLDHIGFVGFVGLGVWTLIISTLLITRTEDSTDGA
jgi:hypothetical protein